MGHASATAPRERGSRTAGGLGDHPLVIIVEPEPIGVDELDVEVRRLADPRARIDGVGNHQLHGGALEQTPTWAQAGRRGSCPLGKSAATVFTRAR